MRRMISRGVGAFSQREMVGCAQRSVPGRAGTAEFPGSCTFWCEAQSPLRSAGGEKTRPEMALETEAADCPDERCRSGSGNRRGDSSDMRRMPGRKGVVGLAGARNAMSSTMDLDPVRAFLRK